MRMGGRTLGDASDIAHDIIAGAQATAAAAGVAIKDEVTKRTIDWWLLVLLGYILLTEDK